MLTLVTTTLASRLSMFAECARQRCAESVQSSSVQARLRFVPFVEISVVRTAEVTSKTARAEFQESGFGISDFLRAASYPFQHKAALDWRRFDVRIPASRWLSRQFDRVDVDVWLYLPRD